MARCFEESKRAYTSGDGAHAKALSNEGKEHKAKMEQLHGEASAWIYASESRSFSTNGPQMFDAACSSLTFRE